MIVTSASNMIVTSASNKNASIKKYERQLRDSTRLSKTVAMARKNNNLNIMIMMFDFIKFWKFLLICSVSIQYC